MIVLDTNVVSETMKPNPDAAVKHWLNAQSAQTLYLTSVTIAELKFGVGIMPEGKRKEVLSKAVDGLIQLFKNHILPFDLDAANEYAKLAVRAKQQGKGLPTPDGYIAAIAASRGFIIASRDTAPFLAADLKVINPWQV